MAFDDFQPDIGSNIPASSSFFRMDSSSSFDTASRIVEVVSVDWGDTATSHEILRKTLMMEEEDLILSEDRKVYPTKRGGVLNGL